MRKKKCGNGVKGWSRASSIGTLWPCILSTSRFLMHGAGRRSRNHLPGVFVDVWNDVYTPADNWSRLKWPGEVKVILLEMTKECRGGTYMTIDELAPYADESVEFLVNDEFIYHAGDLTVPARPDSGIDMRQGPSGTGPRPEMNDDEQMDQGDDLMEGKEEKSNGLDLGALERDLLVYQFSEDDDGEVDGNLLLMTPPSFMSPTREALASLFLVDPIGLAMDYRSRDIHKLLHESPRRRRVDETMRVSFLSTLPEEEWERYQSKLERKAGVTWNRVTFMERTWYVISRYGTQSVMKVGLNRPIMREVLEKLISSVESDVLTEDSADAQRITRKLLIRRAKKGLKRLKGKTGSKNVNQKLVKSKASAVVASLAEVARPSESGQEDGATLAGGEKEHLIPPIYWQV